MVLDEDLNPLHELSEEGKKEHQRIMDKITAYKKAHPVLWHLKKLFKKF